LAGKRPSNGIVPAAVLKNVRLFMEIVLLAVWITAANCIKN